MAKIRVFLSYSSADRPIAERIHVAIEAAGYEVFFDRDSLPAGESFDVRILDAINESDLFIFLLSPESIKVGAYTLTELGFARRKWSNPAGRVLPVVTREIDLQDLPVYLRPVTLLEPKGNVAAEVVAAVHELSKRRWRFAKWVVVALSIIASAVAIGHYTFKIREYNCRLSANSARAFANRMIDFAKTAAQRELDIISDLDMAKSEGFNAEYNAYNDRSLNSAQRSYKESNVRFNNFSRESIIEDRLSSVVKENNSLMSNLAKESNQYRSAIFARCLDGGDVSNPESDLSFDMKHSIKWYTYSRSSPRFEDFLKLAKQLEELADRASGEGSRQSEKSDTTKD